MGAYDILRKVDARDSHWLLFDSTRASSINSWSVKPLLILNVNHLKFRLLIGIHAESAVSFNVRCFGLNHIYLILLAQFPLFYIQEVLR